MILTKELQFQAEKALPADDALAIINKLALEPMASDALYIGRARLANTSLDRSFEKFPLEYLERFAETLPGKPILEGHDKTKSPAGRWFSASLARDENGVTHLVGDFYTLAKSELTDRIKAGIASAMSIGFKAAGRTCDLCGAPYDGCPHQAGQEYDGKRATVTYTGPRERVEAMEGSFVWVGCQYGAQAMGMKSLLPGGGITIGDPEPLSTAGGDEMEKAELEARNKALETELAALKAGFTDTETFAAEGKQYRIDLLAEIGRKLGVLEMPAELQLKLLANADVPMLKQFDADLNEKVNAKLGGQPQSKMLGAGADVLPELRGEKAAAGPPPVMGQGLRTSVFHNWDEEE